MALRFIAIDPTTDDDGSPTIWEDENGDLIIQSYRADAATLAACVEAGSVPGHSTNVPPHETVIRIPARMRQFLAQL